MVANVIRLPVQSAIADIIPQVVFSEGIGPPKEHWLIEVQLKPTRGGEYADYVKWSKRDDFDAEYGT